MDYKLTVLRVIWAVYFKKKLCELRTRVLETHTVGHKLVDDRVFLWWTPVVLCSLWRVKSFHDPFHPMTCVFFDFAGKA